MSLNFKVKDGEIDKNLILIAYLETKIKDYLIKSEISSNDDDENVIVVQIASGPKEVLFCDYLYDNFTIQIFGSSIRDQKQTAYEIGLFPGKNETFEYNGKKYQLLFKEMSNPTNVFYQDIRRVGYTLTLQIVLKERS